jgi:hypothetical protein
MPATKRIDQQRSSLRDLSLRQSFRIDKEAANRTKTLLIALGQSMKVSLSLSSDADQPLMSLKKTSV